MKKLVFAFHGYGSNGDDLLFLKKHFHKLYPNHEIIFSNPNAPFKSGHFGGYQWFPIDVMDEEYITNGIVSVYPIVSDIIMQDVEKHNVDWNDVVVCGFSQGAALAIHAGLRLPQRVEKIISFSGGMANHNSIIETDNINHSPVILFHGNQDQILPHFFSLRAYKTLKKTKIPVEIEIIDGMGHTIDDNVINLLYSKMFI
ncbi:MAG: hypothetical protein RL208_424 [Pseudomonadota bacterium]|jgi:phospholipase/carboxylesterase